MVPLLLPVNWKLDRTIRTNDIEGGVADAVAGAEIAERVSNTRGQMIARTIEAIILVDTLDLVRLRFAAQESLDAALAPAEAACEITDDADQRQHAVEEAEKILAGDCIGHNHLWFRRYANGGNYRPL